MGRVSTNETGFQYTRETTVGVLPGSPIWYQMEPNTVGKFGADIGTTVRAPISNNRQRRKGTIVDLDSSVDLEADLTLSSFIDFAEGFAFASFSDVPVFAPTAATGSGYTVAAGGALAQNTLVFARGFTTSANNGLKLVGSGSSGTNVAVTGLTTESSPPTNAELAVCGVVGASGDIEMDGSGDLISTTLDFTTLGLSVGQLIKIGGTATDTFFVNVTANNGYARVMGISANLLTLDKRSGVFNTDNGSSKTIQLFFGRFLRNVPVDNGDYLEQSFQIEALWSNLQNPGPGDKYQYAVGNYCNEMSFNLPLTEKATISYGFIGTDTENPTTSRKTGASTGIAPNQTAAFNTTSDIARLRVTEVDETGLTTDFKNVTLTINNNVSPEKVLGVLGARYINTGSFEINLSGSVVFTASEVIDAVRNNTTVTMDFILKNDDGAISIDIPAMTLGDGSFNLPANESVQLNLTGAAFADTTLNTSIGISLFPHIPS